MAWTFVAIIANVLSIGFALTNGRRNFLADRGNYSIHVLLTRALFDHQDHKARINAIRDTWGKDQRIRLNVLNFGSKRFEEQFRNWCRDPKSCKLQYDVAAGETDVPKNILASQLWNLDGHVWAMRLALEDATCQWIMLGQDMLYLHMNHLKAYVSTFDYRKSQVLGVRLHGWDMKQMPSPWGVLISRGAAQGIVDNWEKGLRETSTTAECGKLGGLTDFAFGRALQQLRPPAEFVDTRNAKGEDRLLLWPPSRMERNDWWDSWYPRMRVDKPKKAVSPDAFLFFFAGPDEIRELGAFFEHRGGLDSFLQASAQKQNRSIYKASTWRMLDALRK